MRVHVAGAAGYAAAEVIRLVLHHPSLELGALESDSHADEAIATHAPMLRRLERRYDPPGTILETLEQGDIVVSAGRPEAARWSVPRFVQAGARVVDLSDAFRLAEHAGGAAYGFTERYRDRVARAKIVANPGCYPTATLLALFPLASAGVRVEHVVVDAKSGITGAGRVPALSSMFAEVDGDVRAYGLDGHRHTPEIAEQLAAAGLAAPLLFTPHVVPVRRGMLVDAYAYCAQAPDADAVDAAYARAYAGSAFVRVLPKNRAPSLAAVAGTNDAEVRVSVHGRVVRALCAIDNLGKGAAGQAIQNVNVMLGLPEECGFDAGAIVA
jgi:N-acetyl-gamma-glutamyl-phosphate reductase